MARRQAHSLIYAPQVMDQLLVIKRKEHSGIRKAIEEELLFQPDVETTYRKPLREPFHDACWELRFGRDNEYGVFYEVDSENQQVRILGFGVKVGDRLLIGIEEVQL
jgi:hypothetical protein